MDSSSPPPSPSTPATRSASRPRRPTPAAIAASYVIGFGSVFVLLALELFDLDGLLDHLPAGLLFFWTAAVAVALAVVAIDLVITRLDRRARARRRPPGA